MEEKKVVKVSIVKCVECEKLKKSIAILEDVIKKSKEIIVILKADNKKFAIDLRQATRKMISAEKALKRNTISLNNKVAAVEKKYQVLEKKYIKDVHGKKK